MRLINYSFTILLVSLCAFTLAVIPKDSKSHTVCNNIGVLFKGCWCADNWGGNNCDYWVGDPNNAPSDLYCPDDGVFCNIQTYIGKNQCRASARCSMCDESGKTCLQPTPTCASGLVRLDVGGACIDKNNFEKYLTLGISRGKTDVKSGTKPKFDNSNNMDRDYWWFGNGKYAEYPTGLGVPRWHFLASFWLNLNPSTSEIPNLRPFLVIGSRSVCDAEPSFWNVFATPESAGYRLTLEMARGNPLSNPRITTQLLSYNRLYHVAALFDSTFAIYTDGHLSASGPVSEAIPKLNIPAFYLVDQGLQIGSSPCTGYTRTNNFNWMVAHVRIYQKADFSSDITTWIKYLMNLRYACDSADGTPCYMQCEVTRLGITVCG